MRVLLHRKTSSARERNSQSERTTLMAMNAGTLGVIMRNQMLATCSVENFGAALRSAEMAVINTLDQDSDPADYDAYLTAKYEATAGAVIGYLINNAQLWAACADAIVDHITGNAEIASLSCNQTPTDGPGHVHNVSTVGGQKEIS